MDAINRRKLNVSVSPHTRDTVTTKSLMGLVIAALIPACAVGVMNYGEHALMVLLSSAISSVLAEYLYEKILKKNMTAGDLSALVTGILIGMNMPPGIALWIPCLGSFFAIIVVKQLYGGLGQNFMNPALAARCFLLISFAGRMTDFTPQRGVMRLVTEVPGAADALSGATPLAYLKTGMHFSLKALFLGNTAGCIGETSALAILAGGIFLVLAGVISIRIPGCYIGTFALLTLICASLRHYDNPLLFMLEEVCAGGLMLGAWFMATDYVTSPVTPRGRTVYGILLGVLTWIFRMIGTSAEGVSYAIIFMNLLVPVIEHFTVPAAFGVRREKVRREKKSRGKLTAGLKDQKTEVPGKAGGRGHEC